MYNDEVIVYTVKTDKKLKNLYITISPKDGVIVKNPNFTQKRVKEIVNSKANWIYKKIQNTKQVLNIQDIYEKENKVLYLGKKSSLHVENLEEFYRNSTKKIVLKEIEKISSDMGLFPTKISFRKTKRRWGSCNYKNELSFAITISQLPLSCIKYIICHELAHIKHKNHKKEFYETIKNFMPDFKTQEKILKNYSPRL